MVSDVARGEIAANSVAYQLAPDTTYLKGCVPCSCPLTLGVLIKGTFLLTPTGFDGLYNNYDITNISWVFVINRTNLFVTGSGTYKVGGEVALQQELSLSLHLGTSLAEHFDSGLVPNSTPFPGIKITLSNNGRVCFNNVFNVSASPVPVPELHLAVAGDNTIVLSWPLSTAAFALQQSSDLTANGWATVTNVPSVIDQQNQITLSRTSATGFYRLVPSGN